MNKVAVVTCTGGRPELFALCQQWVQRQTVRPDVWIVSSDIPGEPAPGGLPDFAAFVRCEPRAPSGGMRASEHLGLALAHVPEDHHAILMEDDDWYAPDHIASLLPMFEQDRMVGNRFTRHYHLPKRTYKLRTNTEANTGIRSDFVPFYREHAHEPNWAGRAWTIAKSRPRGPSTHTAIKGVGFGLPGRRGATRKHEGTMDFEPDSELEVFRHWVPSPDAELYLALLLP